MLLYIVRHGETEFNAERRLQGQYDAPLNKNGRDLAKKTGEELKDVSFDLVLTSPLERSVETAKLLLGNRQAPIIKDDRLKEFCMGEWEGLLFDEIQKRDVEQMFQKYWNDPMHYAGAPGGESTEQVFERAKDFFDEITQNQDYQDKTILISSHGGTIRAILHNVYDDKNDFWHGQVPPNCSLNIVSIKDGIITLLEEDKIYYEMAGTLHSVNTI